ncbi:hypothetical protein F2Q70_00045180 [Brassica cretica]|uniref:Uncharacterized protein n=1 Tax=Brassica cretica TaxID=69181 RepID=A0A8S9KHH4_BRACR|nr:hypothetical protein F2Q70_00045180 [Brassica cretica]
MATWSSFSSLSSAAIAPEEMTIEKAKRDGQPESFVVRDLKRQAPFRQSPTQSVSGQVISSSSWSSGSGPELCPPESLSHQLQIEEKLDGSNNAQLWIIVTYGPQTLAYSPICLKLLICSISL